MPKISLRTSNTDLSIFFQKIRYSPFQKIYQKNYHEKRKITKTFLNIMTCIYPGFKRLENYLHQKIEIERTW